MLKGASKALAAIMLATAVASCGGNAEREAAERLLDEVRTAVDNKRFEEALGLLDTLSVLHPGETKAIREGMAIRPVAIEGLTIRQLETTDSLLAVAAWRADSLSALFRTVSDARMVEPYTVAAAAPGGIYTRTGIEARVTPEGGFNLISSLTGARIHHTSVTLSDGAESATTDNVPVGSEANYTVGGSETVTFSVNKCDTIGAFAVAHDNRPLRLTFNGSKSHSVKLSAKEVHAIADTYRLASVRRQGMMLNKKKELLRAKLQVARDQQARTAQTE